MIIITKQQKEFIESKNKLPHILMPIEIKGGVYILPENVLDDENHFDKKEFLLTLPKREVLESELLGE